MNRLVGKYIFSLYVAVCILVDFFWLMMISSDSNMDGMELVRAITFEIIWAAILTLVLDRLFKPKKELPKL